MPSGSSFSHYPLDNFDRAILRILQRNNKIPQREIGKEVNLSAAAVQRRIAAMEEHCVIRGNVAIVKPEAVAPVLTIVVEVHMETDRSAAIDAAKALFRETPEVQQCYYVTGGAGFILVMLVPDMPTYDALARRLFSDNETVKTFRTLVVLDRVKVGLEVVI